MEMTSSYQFQSEPALLEWLPNLRSEISGLDFAPYTVFGELGTLPGNRVARILVALRHFFAARDDAGIWPGTSPVTRDGYFSERALGGKRSNVTIRSGGRTLPPTTGHASRSVWGSWQ